MGFLDKIGLGFVEDALKWVLGIEDPEAPSTTVNKQSNIEPLPVIYGQRKVSGTRVFVSTGGGQNNEYLYIALALCEGEIDSIGDVYINDVLSTDAKFSGKLTIQKYIGSDDQTATTLFADADTSWTSAHRLRGVAYLAMRFKYDSDTFSGIPEVKAVVNGRKVYDPRQDSTSTHYDASVGVSTQRQGDQSTWKYSSNNAICLRDYLTNARFGKGLPTSAINDASFVSAADDCDDIVTSYTSGPDISLFSCNGVFPTDSTVFDNVKTFLGNMRGIMAYEYGQYKLKIDKPESSTFDLTPDNILSDIKITSNSKNKKYNKVTAKFTNPDANWQEDTAIWPPAGSTEETTFLAADNNQELATEITLSNTTNFYAARDLARIVCLASRDAGLQIELTATSEAFNIAVGDVVRLEQPSLGWTGAARKLARVSSMQLQDSGEVDLQLQEYSASVYTWDEGSQAPDSPATSLPDPFTIAPPTNLSATASTQQGDDGTTLSYVDVSWTAADDAFVAQYELTYTPAGGNAQTVIINNTDYQLLIIDTSVDYTFSVKSINSLGVKSTAATVSGISPVIDTVAPGVPTSLSVTGTFKQIELKWANPSDSDFKYVEIKRAGTTVEGDAVVIATTAGDSYIDGNYSGVVTRYYWLRAVDYSGNASAWVSGGAGTTQHLVTDDFDDGIISIDHINQTFLNTIDGKASQTSVDDINANLTTVESDIVGIVNEQQDFGNTIDTIATRMLTLAVDQSEYLGLMRDAGITVDPNNGTVSIQAVESLRTETQTSINNVQIDLDAAEAEITLKASTTYVNNAIASAVLDSADLASLNALEAQVNQAEIDIDANTASIALKADATTVTGLDVRISQAEVDINAAEASILLKADQTDFTNLENRVTTAEIDISALDAASITQTVADSRSNAQAIDKSAITSLRDVLNQYRDRENTIQDLAFTRTQIFADVNDQRESLARQRTELAALIDTNTANIISEQTARATADSALASDITALTATVDTNTASIQTESTSRADADTALASDITSLSATVDQNAANIATESTARADADTALASDITALTTTVGNNTTAISTEQTARTDADTALASDITALTTTVGDNTTAITNEVTARTTADTALASDITALTTTVGGHTTSIATNTTSINGVKAQYSVTINNNDHVTGFGLVSDIIDGNPTSSFTVNADSFGIGATDATDEYPFVVYTTAQNITKNGTSYTIPAGTYIADAFIQNAAIGNAEIQTAAITTAKIDNLAVESAKIDNLAVTEGKIANLAVDTLKIKDNAVTIPSNAFTTAEQKTGTGEVTLQEVTYTSTGAPATVTFSAMVKAYNIGFGGNAIGTLKIYRGTTLLHTYDGVINMPYNQTTTIGFTIQDTPSAGSVDYIVKGTSTSNNGHGYTLRSLSVLEVKK